jgi:hypothetical protein
MSVESPRGSNGKLETEGFRHRVSVATQRGCGRIGPQPLRAARAVDQFFSLSTSLLAPIHGIIARSSLPTSSI